MYKKAKVTHTAVTKVTDVLRTENLLFNFGGIEGELKVYQNLDNVRVSLLSGDFDDMTFIVPTSAGDVIVDNDSTWLKGEKK